MALSLLWPLAGTVTQEFGGSNGHGGIDIGVPTGTPVHAAEAGLVTSAGWNSGGYGNLVILDHGSFTVTYYAHLDSVAVKAGDRVTRGQVIGASGNTGRSTGPHLHWEVRTQAGKVNPRMYVAGNPTGVTSSGQGSSPGSVPSGSLTVGPGDIPSFLPDDLDPTVQVRRLLDAFGGLSRFAGMLATPGTWVRVLLFGLGAGLVVGGVVWIERDTIGAAVGTAADVAKVAAL